MVFQEPMASLSPMYTVGAQLIEAIQLHEPIPEGGGPRARDRQLRRVGIPQPERRIDAYPFQLSGGMCQRVMIAIALSCDPALLIADEPTTALDVTTQARILDLLKDLQDQTGMAMVFITHDLGVVAEIADEVTVMYLGKVAEHGTVEEIFGQPKHPYTQALLRSIPIMRGTAERQRLAAIRGMVPHPQNRPPGCPFHTRCEHAIAGAVRHSRPAADPVRQRPAGHVPPVRGERRAQGVRERRGRRRGGYTRRSTGRQTWRLPTVRRRPPPSGRTRPASRRTRSRCSRYATCDALRDQAGHVRTYDRSDPRGRRGRPHHPARRDARPGGGVRLRQDHGRPLPRPGRSTRPAGTMHYRTTSGETVDLATLRNRDLKPYRREIRVVFQDPFSSLNPRMTLLQLVGEPLKTNELAVGVGDPGPGGRDAATRGPAAGVHAPVPARVLRRGAAADQHRPGAHHRAAAGDRGRGGLGARRVGARPDPQPAVGPAGRVQPDVPLHLPRPVGHRAPVRPGRGDVPRQARRDRRDVDAVLRRRTTPTPRRCSTRCRCPTRSKRRARHEHALPDDLPDPSNPPPGCLFHTRCPHVQPTRCEDEVPELRTTGASSTLPPATTPSRCLCPEQPGPRERERVRPRRR